MIISIKVLTVFLATVRFDSYGDGSLQQFLFFHIFQSTSGPSNQQHPN
jgi:hypothetical protein